MTLPEFYGELRDQAPKRSSLTPHNQRLVCLNLASLVVVAVLLVAAVPITSFRDDKAAAVEVIVVALAPGALALWRVLSHNRWAASRLVPRGAAPSRCVADDLTDRSLLRTRKPRQ
jgi:hypothetical protein